MTPTPVVPLPTPTVAAQTAPLTSEVLVGLLLSALLALLVLLIGVAIARFARAATLRALGRTRADASTQLLVGRAVFIAIFVLGALAALGALGVPWPTVVALTGVL